MKMNKKKIYNYWMRVWERRARERSLLGERGVRK